MFGLARPAALTALNTAADSQPPACNAPVQGDCRMTQRNRRRGTCAKMRQTLQPLG